MKNAVLNLNNIQSLSDEFSHRRITSHCLDAKGLGGSLSEKETVERDIWAGRRVFRSTVAQR